MSDGGANRIDIGFSGGQVLSLRMSEDAYRSLGDEVQSGSQGWHEVAAEDSTVMVNLGQVVYVRLDTEEHTVGFSAA